MAEADTRPVNPLANPSVIKRHIVSEVTKNWPGQGSDLATQLQKVIDANAAKGYRLESWQMGMAIAESAGAGQRATLIQSIVAVFVEA